MNGDERDGSFTLDRGFDEHVEALFSEEALREVGHLSDEELRREAARHMKEAKRLAAEARAENQARTRKSAA